MKYSTPKFSHAVSGTGSRPVSTTEAALEILDGLGRRHQGEAARALAEGLWGAESDEAASLERAYALLLAFAVEGKIAPNQYGRGFVETC
jgi:hypothetical protein